MPPSTVWKKGQSGNPKGRPPKDRALTAILESAGNAKVEGVDKAFARKKILADLLWQAAVTGQVVFPTPDEKGELQKMPVLGSDWLSVVQFIYKHIDGPPKAELDVTSGGEKLKGYALISPDDWDNDDSD